MRLRALFGILSVVFWLLAVLTIALPLASVLLPGAIAIVPNQTNSASTQSSFLNIPTNFTVSNHGFLPIDGVYLSVIGLYPNGTQIFSVKSPMVDLAPGSTTQMSIATDLPTVTASNTAAFQGLTSITLKAVATATLGGLIPISASADFVAPINAPVP